ncbi:MAG: polymerase LigD, polymerase domain protein [Acidimicrobiaceae bacterium]|nr:polymerase LigD, polymerase domain protein [Acidimicrobiaceae bacterium]
MSSERVETEIDGRRISLSNLDKVLYPATRFTKGALLDYYARIAPVMLPHVRDRALTLRRFPDGVDGPSFFEKHAPSHTPTWVRTVHVPTAAAGGAKATKGSGDIEYAVICDRPTLIWAANLATIEFHVPLWRVGRHHVLPGPPDHLVFDLDPGPGTSIVQCCQVASWIAERLAKENLEPVAKTSGSKGLQLYARLSRSFPWPRARDLAHEVAQSVEGDHQDLVVTNMRKDLREGRVLIDWSQNHPAKTTVAAYSLRARPEPTVSTPVTWDEVADCARSGDAQRLRFLAGEVLERVERLGDLFAPLASRP